MSSLDLRFKENRMILNEQKIRLYGKKGLYFQKTEKIKPSLSYNQKLFYSLEFNDLVPENHPMEINRKKEIN